MEEEEQSPSAQNCSSDIKRKRKQTDANDESLSKQRRTFDEEPVTIKVEDDVIDIKDETGEDEEEFTEGVDYSHILPTDMANQDEVTKRRCFLHCIFLLVRLYLLHFKT